MQESRCPVRYKTFDYRTTSPSPPQTQTHKLNLDMCTQWDARVCTSSHACWGYSWCAYDQEQTAQIALTLPATNTEGRRVSRQRKKTGTCTFLPENYHLKWLDHSLLIILFVLSVSRPLSHSLSHSLPLCVASFIYRATLGLFVLLSWNTCEAQGSTRHACN